MAVTDGPVGAREAFDRRDWAATYDALVSADVTGMEPDDHARLATAAYLLGRRSESVRCFQTAFQAHLDRGETLAAVRTAFWLAMVLHANGEEAICNGWVARSERLLADQPDDIVERGYLLIHAMYRFIFQPDHERAYELALEVTDFGRRFHEPDLLATGLAGQGRLLIYAGHVREGLALLDEAMVGVAAGELSPIMDGDVFCSLIEGCQEVSDFSRAAEWTKALSDWCDAQPGLVPFRGQCAVHRGQLMRVHGAYDRAVEELERAAAHYAEHGPLEAAGLALGERGDVLRIRGDLDAAEASYAEASRHGYEPQPGLVLLWLARDRTDAALAAMHRLLLERQDPVGRSQVLAAAVEVLLAAGEADEASGLADELTRVAADFGCAALQASADHAGAAVRLHGGDARGALPQLRKAAHAWRTLNMPFEGARTSVLKGTAMRELGDEESAVAELTAAHRTFVELGARPAAEQVRRLLTPKEQHGLTSREIEVLRLVASGRSNPQIAEVLVISEKTVARHCSNIFTKIGVSSRSAATAFAYEQRLV